jgi:hypothetical protein
MMAYFNIKLAIQNIKSKKYWAQVEGAPKESDLDELGEVLIWAILQLCLQISKS